MYVKYLSKGEEMVYTSRARSIISNVKKNDDLRDAIIKRDVNGDEVALMEPKDMAPNELKKRREKKE